MHNFFKYNILTLLLALSLPTTLSAQQANLNTIEPVLVYANPSGGELRQKLQSSELKVINEVIGGLSQYSPFGVSSEIQLSATPIRIELIGYTPKSFMRYGEMVAFEFHHPLFGKKSRLVQFNYDSVHLQINIFNGREIKDTQLEKSKDGVWQVVFSKDLKPGNYGIMFKEHPFICWDFDVIKK